MYICYCTNKRRTGGVQVLLHLFLTWALGGGEWPASGPGRFTAGNEHSDAMNKRMGGPQTWSGVFGEEKNVLPLPGFESLIFQSVAQSRSPTSRFIDLEE